MSRFFLDTYAMIEYLRGNRNYLKFISPESDPVTSLMNLVELYFLILREHYEETADKAYLAFRQFETPIVEDDIRSGMKLRLSAQARRLDLSYADAIGYAISERLGTKYLTGDGAFREFPNVEFIR